MYHFVGLLDAEGNVLEINRVALEGAGIRLDEIQGKPFWEARWLAVSNETQHLQRALVEQARAGEFARRYIEIYCAARIEGTIIINLSLEPVRDHNGNIVFLLPKAATSRRRNAPKLKIGRKNEEIKQLSDRNRELERLKNEFSANVSHELRTRLALILGSAESTLASDYNLTELQRRELAVIQRNVTHVNDFLGLSKLDAGRHTVEYSRIELVRQVRAVAAHFDALAFQRSRSYVVTAPDNLEAEVLAGKFDRILINLLSNAFRFTPSGGRIQCTLEINAADHVLLRVQDSRPGVKAEMRNTIFRHFRHAQTGAPRGFGGTGLGLAIAKDFAGLHGGTITVSDAPGGGALFQVELPRFAPEGTYVRQPESVCTVVAVPNVDAETAELPPGPVSGGPVLEDDSPLGRPHVMVVEDNAEMRRFVTTVLGEEYHVVAAANEEEALAKALAWVPDLVVTDLMMPKIECEPAASTITSAPTSPARRTSRAEGSPWT